MSFATSDLFDFGSPVKMIKHDGGLLDIQSLTLPRDTYILFTSLLPFSFCMMSSFFALFSNAKSFYAEFFCMGGGGKSSYLKEELRFLSTNALLTIAQTTT